MRGMYWIGFQPTFRLVVAGRIRLFRIGRYSTDRGVVIYTHGDPELELIVQALAPDEPLAKDESARCGDPPKGLKAGRWGIGRLCSLPPFGSQASQRCLDHITPG